MKPSPVDRTFDSLFNDIHNSVLTKCHLEHYSTEATISYLKEQYKLHQLRDVCTLLTRGLACNGMIRMLPYQFKNK